MQSMRRIFAKSRRNEGAALLEFAIVAPIFFLFVFAVIEYGLVTFTQIAIESATMRVARESSLGKGSNAANQVALIQQEVRNRTMGLINASQVVVTAGLVSVQGAPPAPDICMTNPPTVGGSCPVGIPWEDVNRNGVYDGNLPAPTLGTYGDLVEIRVSYPWKVLFPIFNSHFGQHGVLLITSSTILKNEP